MKKDAPKFSSDREQRRLLLRSLVAGGCVLAVGSPSLALGQSLLLEKGEDIDELPPSETCSITELSTETHSFMAKTGTKIRTGVSAEPAGVTTWSVAVDVTYSYLFMVGSHTITFPEEQTITVYESYIATESLVPAKSYSFGDTRSSDGTNYTWTRIMPTAPVTIVQSQEVIMTATYTCTKSNMSDDGKFFGDKESQSVRDVPRLATLDLPFDLSNPATRFAQPGKINL